MKKKNLLYLLSIVMVAMMSVSFVSCGDDDNDYKSNDAAQISLVGTWYLKYSDGSGWWRIVIRKDGTGVETLYSNDGKTEITENYQFSYTYYDITKELIINYTTGDGGSISYSVRLSGNTLMLFIDDHTYYLFRRQ